MLKLLKNLKKKDWLFLFISVVLICFQVWIELTLPEFTINIIKELYKTQYGINPEINVIIKNGALMLSCALASLASAIIVGLLVSRVAARLGLYLREKIYNKIQSFSLKEMNKFSTASLITRTTNDIRQVVMIITVGTQAFVKAPIMAVWAIIKIINKGWQWSLATGIAIFIMLVVIVIIMIFVIPKFRKVQNLTDELNLITRENLTGIRVVKASNAEEYQNKKFEKTNNELTKTNMFIGKMLGILSPGMSLIMSGLNLAIYWIGANIVYNDITYSNMTVFTQYAIQVIFSFIMLVVIFMLLPRAIVSAKRINEVLDTDVSIKTGKFINEEKIESITFRNISFKYPNADEYVLKNINFEVKKGETIAFIGSTGSGKSTLINLIPRLYDASEGNIFINGIDIKEYNLKELYKKIGYIPQKGYLFSGTINSNINFGDNNSSNDDIEKAIKISQSKEFIEKLNEDKNSFVAQSGKNLSGGQKQRISIARALARNPEILIFDDSFSALDYKTDKKLRKELKNYGNNITKFIVAQRIGTIKDSDKIIVLEKGEIVGIGKHKDLLKDCPVYKEIALSQLSKEELK